MIRRFVLIVLAAALLPAGAASFARARHDAEAVVALPLTGNQCRTLIDAGAPFSLGGPDTAPVCLVAGGTASIVALPFDRQTCRRLIALGAPFLIGDPNQRFRCAVAISDPEI
jgi:guanyl-specific ribonuclease Sa